MATLLQRLQAIEAALEGPDRFLDMRLDWRAPDGSTVLVAGGKWDRTFGRFLDPVTEGDADTRVVIDLQASQVEFAQFFAERIANFRDGYPDETQLAMLAGDRRGGKSFVLLAAVVAACIDVPIASNGTPLIAWLVSKTYRERFELEQWILQRIPSRWYRHQAAPEHQFVFVHGPTLRLLSADDPDGLKQGRCDVAAVNEPQKMGARALANIILGVSDLGGLTILAANPPSGDSRGEWLFDVKEALDDEAVAVKQGKRIDALGVRYFHVDSKQNQAIDQIARKKAGKLAALIDPSIQAGDVEGSWRRPSERALWEFDKHRHLHAVPSVGVVDITRQIAAERGEWGDWQYVAGIDFQSKPYIVACIWRVFGDMDDPTFWAVDEFAGEKRWTEEQFLDAFADKFPVYTRNALLWIGDASSTWQGSKHAFDEGERDSFDVFRSDRWTILQPQEARGKTGRGRNPYVDDRLQLVNELLRRDRIRIDPARCPWLAECAREATTKRDTGRRKLVGNKFAHMIDAATYPIYRLGRQSPGDRPTAADARFAKPRRPATW